MGDKLDHSAPLRKRKSTLRPASRTQSPRWVARPPVWWPPAAVRTSRTRSAADRTHLSRPCAFLGTQASWQRSEAASFGRSTPASLAAFWSLRWPLGRSSKAVMPTGHRPAANLIIVRWVRLIFLSWFQVLRCCFFPADMISSRSGPHGHFGTPWNGRKARASDAGASYIYFQGAADFTFRLKRHGVQ